MMQLPEIKPRRKPRPAYRKSDAVKELERMADAAVQQKYVSVQAKYLSPRKYRDDTANGLTKCIIDFLRLKGCQSERTSCTGRYVDNTKVFTNVLGYRRQIGTAKWLPTSGQRGTADISAVIRSRAVKIEVKMKDKQSDDQRSYQEAVEAAGGCYLICHSLNEFMQQYENFKL